ncbi:Ig-like domain-containing protein, partial [Chitinophaga lutea]
MRRLLLLLIFICSALAGMGQAQTPLNRDTATMTFPATVCSGNYGSFRAYWARKADPVDRVNWVIKAPDGSTITRNYNQPTSDLTDPNFRFFGSNGQTMTFNFTQVGLYRFEATVTGDSRTRTVVRYVRVENCPIENCTSILPPTTDFHESFGTFTSNEGTRSLPAGATITYKYDNNPRANNSGAGTSINYSSPPEPSADEDLFEDNKLLDGYYSIFWNSWGGGRKDWDYVTDHTGDLRGGMLIANSGYDRNIFYKRQITGLCPGSKYNFSAWFINLNSRQVIESICQNNTYDNNPYRYAGVTFIIRNAVTNAEIKRFNTNDVSMDLGKAHMSSSDATKSGWQQYGGQIEIAAGQESVYLEIENNNPGGCGNDIAVDDIRFQYCAPKIHALIDNQPNKTGVLMCAGAEITLNAYINPVDYFTDPRYYWEMTTTGNPNDPANNTWVPVPTTGYSGTNANILRILPNTLADGAVYHFRLMVIENGNAVGGTSCYTPSAPVTLETAPLPELTASKSKICEGETVILTANPLKTATNPNGYENFSFSGNYIIPWPGPGAAPLDKIAVKPPVTTTYSATGSLSFGMVDGAPRVCTKTVLSTIEVVQPPVLELGPDVTLCAGEQVTFDVGAANAAYNIQWTPGNYTTQTATYTAGGADNNVQQITATVKKDVCTVTDVVNLTTRAKTNAVINGISEYCMNAADTTATRPELAFQPSVVIGAGYTVTWELFNNTSDAYIVANPGVPNGIFVRNIPYNEVLTLRMHIQPVGMTCIETVERTIQIDLEPEAIVANVTNCTNSFQMAANAVSLGDAIGWWTVAPSSAGRVTIPAADLNNPNAIFTLNPGYTSAVLYWNVGWPTGRYSPCSESAQRSATLTLSPPPTITIPNQTLCANPAGGAVPAISLSGRTTNSPTAYDLSVTPALPGFTNLVNQPVSSAINITYSSAAAPGVYTFTITAKKSVGPVGKQVVCSTPSTFTLTIERPTPTPVVVADDNRICVGGSATLTVTSALGTNANWRWYTGSCGGTLIASNVDHITVSPTTTTTYYVRAEGASICANSACTQITVQVDQLPTTANAGPDQVRCDATSFTLAANNATTGTGQWAFVGAQPAGVTITNPASPASTLTGLPTNSSVTLEWVITNGDCVSRDEVTLTNQPPITGNTISAAQHICAGSDAADLTGTAVIAGGNGTYTYQWKQSSSATTGFWPIAGATGATYDPGVLNATTYYKRIITSGTCVDSSNIIRIQVNQVPVFTVNSPIDACNASGKFEVEYVISAGNPTLYDLTALPNALPGFINLTDQPITTGKITINYDASTPAGTYNFRIRFKDAIGCYSEQDFTVTLESLSVPAWIEITPSRVCAGSTITLTAKGGTLGTNANWVWYIDNCGNGTPIGYGTTFTRTVNATTTFAVRAESNRACKNSDCATATITVDQMPLDADAGPDQEQCNNGSFSLAAVAAAPAPAVGTWSFVPSQPAGVTISDIHDPAATVNGVPEGQSVTLRWTITNFTCTSDPDEVTLVNLRRIGNNTVASAQAICPGATPAALTGTLPTGGNGTYTYQWQISTNGTDFTDIGGAAGQNYAPGALTATTWYRRVVSSGTCTHTSLPVQITVNTLPAFTVNNTGAYCTTLGNVSVSYTVTAGTPTRYDLESPNLTGFTAVLNGDLVANPPTIVIPANTPAGQYQFTLTLRDAIGCESEQTFTITFETPSTITDVDASADEICEGESTTLTVNGTLGTGATWTWYTGSCGGTAVGTGTSIVVSPTVTTRYYVRGVSGSMCGNSACQEIEITVFAPPVAANAGSDLEHCNDGNFQLAGNVPAPAGAQGKWSVVSSTLGATAAIIT